MSEMLWLSVSIYLIDSILSGIYTREFLREKYRKRVVLAAWAAVWFFIHHVDFAYPRKLSIDVYDVAVILNNALENAIEACCKTEGDKQIKLHSYVKGSLFFIEFENDFSEDTVIEKESGLPVSSKESEKLHGIGISNIQRCAKKYIGDIDIVISDTDGRKKFSLTVMMNGKASAVT